MKITLISDLHLEFFLDNEKPTFKLPDADLLILAGDITVADVLKTFDRNTVQKNVNWQTANRTWEFFKDISERYEQVVYVAGNHEHYKGNISKTKGIINEFLKEFPNIKYLENEHIEYKGHTIVGATLWTDFGKDPVMKYALGNMMNDYRQIRVGDEYKKLTTDYIALTNLESYAAIAAVVEDAPGPVIVVTHHAPTYVTKHPQWSDPDIDKGYCNDLSEFILDNPKIKLWCHGHIHWSGQYMVGSTIVASNTHGYYGHQVISTDYSDTQFDPDFLLELSNNG